MKISFSKVVKKLQAVPTFVHPSKTAHPDQLS